MVMDDSLDEEISILSDTIVTDFSDGNPMVTMNHGQWDDLKSRINNEFREFWFKRFR